MNEWLERRTPLVAEKNPRPSCETPTMRPPAVKGNAPPAIVNGGIVTVIPIDRPGDNLVPGVDSRGDVISAHDIRRSELWRFSNITK